MPWMKPNLRCWEFSSTHLAKEICKVEDGNKQDRHPASKMAADHFRFNPRKQAKSHKVCHPNGDHVGPHPARDQPPPSNPIWKLCRAWSTNSTKWSLNSCPHFLCCPNSWCVSCSCVPWIEVVSHSLLWSAQSDPLQKRHWLLTLEWLGHPDQDCWDFATQAHHNDPWIPFHPGFRP